MITSPKFLRNPFSILAKRKVNQQHGIHTGQSSGQTPAGTCSIGCRGMKYGKYAAWQNDKVKLPCKRVVYRSRATYVDLPAQLLRCHLWDAGYHGDRWRQSTHLDHCSVRQTCYRYRADMLYNHHVTAEWHYTITAD